MRRLLLLGGALISLVVNAADLRADDRAEAGRLLREALAALARAEGAAEPAVRLAELETVAGLVQRLTRDYGSTYVGLRLAGGQPIGRLDPAELDRLLAEARRGTGAVRATPRPAPAEPAPPATRPGGGRPCERAAVPAAARRPGDPAPSLADVIADCRTALAFEPSAARYRFQLARALSERAQPGDREEAVGLLEAAADAGFTAAKAELCARYLWGIGTAKDPARALALCEAAAREGSEQARALLARSEIAATGRR